MDVLVNDSEKSAFLAEVCVVVRTCGRPAFLRRALQSIARQTVQPRQVVVVAEGDDAGAVREIVASSLAGLANSVMVVSNPVPVGRGAALNQALRTAHTEWIAILDDDDTWEPKFLERAVSCLVASPTRDKGVVVLTTCIAEQERRGSMQELRRWPFNPPAFDAVTIQGLAGGSQFTINAFVYSREAALALGGYREDIPVQEDWEFNLRFVQKYRVGLIREELANYHMRPKARTMAEANSSQVLHELVRQQLIDGWLREDLATGRFGLGQLCMQAGFQREFAAGFRFKRRLLRLLRRLGLRRG